MSEVVIPFLGDAKAYRTWSTNMDRSVVWAERMKRVAVWRDGAYYAGRQWKLHEKHAGPLPYTVVQLEFWVRNASQCDPHNYCGTVLKASIDGLVHANFWPDDTAKYVGHRESIIRGGPPFLPRLHLYMEPLSSE